MSLPAIRALIEKDLRVVLQSRAVSLPLIFVPLLIVVFMPVVFGFIVRTAGATDPEELQSLLAGVPPKLAAELARLTPAQAGMVYFLTYFFAPLYLILPLMVSNVIAADSFAGEKERKTLEALLYTPTSDRELLAAKMLGAWLPGVAVGLLSFVVYCIVANAVAWPILGRIFLPNALWLVLALWVAPAAAGLGLGGSVLVSARANSFQEAYQVGGLVVLPIVALLLAQVVGIVFMGVELALLLGLLLWVLDGVLLWWGGRTFRRDVLAARL